jgi:phosphatidate phosphatase APP1
MRFLQILVLILVSVLLASGQKNGSTAVLTGNIFDQIGDVLPNTKIIVTNQKGQRFETLSDENGSYNINLPVTVYEGNFDIRKLPITKYKVRFETSVFKSLEIEEFNFIQNKSKKLQLDVALEVGIH